VRVDDIDPQGKVSLSLASVPEGAGGGGSSGGGGRDGGRDRDSGAPRREQSAGSSVSSDAPGGSGGSGSSAPSTPAASNGGAGATPSFEDAFEAELVADLGDLGPGAAEGESRGGGNRPPRGRSRRR
jgi:hypothetical protein